MLIKVRINKINFLSTFLIVIVGYLYGSYIYCCQNNNLINIKTLNTGSNVIVHGNIDKFTSNDYGYCYYLKDVTLVSENCNRINTDGVILQSNTELPAKVGDYIKCKSKYDEFKRRSNSGNFDEYEYYTTNGINARFIFTYSKNSFMITQNGSGYKMVLCKIRASISEKIDQVFSKEYAPIFKAILLGDRSELSDYTKQLFKDGGISHILSISGLHISMIGMFIYKVLRKKFSMLTSSIISTVFVVNYTIMVGAPISAVRASIMFLIGIIAIYLGRTYDIISATSLAAIGIIIENPFAIYNTSMILSFGAIVAIIYVTKQITLFLNIKGRLLVCIISSESINICLKPAIAYFYYEVGMLSFISNIIVIPLMAFVVGCAFTAIILAYIQIDIAKFVAAFGEILLWVYKKTCEIVSKLPYSNIICGKPELKRVIIYYVILIGSISFVNLFIRKKKEPNIIEPWRKRYIKRALVLIIFTILNLIILYTKYENKAYVLDVGQGQCICICNSDGSCYLIDAGSSSINEVDKKVIIPFLKSKGIKKIDCLFISHTDSDHVSGINGLLNLKVNNKTYIKNIVMPKIKDNLIDDAYKEIYRDAKAKKVNIVFAKEGLKLNNKNMGIVCVSPQNNPSESCNNKNDCSLVLYLIYKDYRMIIPGDISSSMEKELISSGLVYKSDIYIAAHHGSRLSNSQDFLALIQPETAIISCGKNNNYGHPGIETLDTLNKLKSNIFITFNSGQMTIDFDKFSVESFVK